MEVRALLFSLNSYELLKLKFVPGKKEYSFRIKKLIGGYTDWYVV
jgi:hypothetical protein